MNQPAVPGSTGRSRLTSLIAVGLFFVFAGSLVPMISPATPAEPTGDAAAPAPPDLGSAVVKFVIWTVAILAVAAAALWLAVGKRKPVPPPADGAVRVLATLPIRDRCALYLVDAGGRQILVGVDAGGVKSVLPLPEQAEAMRAERDDPDADSPVLLPVIGMN